jgi:hypothetical protein
LEFVETQSFNKLKSAMIFALNFDFLDFQYHPSMKNQIKNSCFESEVSPFEISEAFKPTQNHSFASQHQTLLPITFIAAIHTLRQISSQWNRQIQRPLTVISPRGSGVGSPSPPKVKKLRWTDPSGSAIPVQN